jgi:hypothetical protein
MSKSKASRDRVSKKIKHLIGEGVSDDQAVAMALSMERAGRISQSGEYIPVKKKNTKKVKTASFESIDTQHHIAHFIVIEGDMEYVDEAYPEQSDDPVEFAIKILKQHAEKFGSKPMLENDGYSFSIINKSQQEKNLFKLVGFDKEETSRIIEVIK